MDNSKNIQDVITSLKNELAVCTENISRVKEEINSKRRNLTELQAKQNQLENKIKATRYEALESLISDKLEMSIDELTGAVKNGGVLVEKTSLKDSFPAVTDKAK